MAGKRMTKLDIILAGNGGTPDSCWEWPYGKTAAGYGSVSMKGRDYYVHRVSYETHTGPIPDGTVIDHACHTRSCWNPQHLRVVTHAQNSQHTQTRVANTSGYRGVSFYKQRNKWVARVRHQGRVIFLGYFDTAEEAAAVAEDKRRELGFLGS